MNFPAKNRSTEPAEPIAAMGGRIPAGQMTAFSLPFFMVGLMHGPVNGILPGVYSKYFGLDLAVIGTILLAAKLFDALTDPAIGYLSDRTRTPIGARKPWFIAGAAVSAPGIFFLFSPPESVTATYYVGWMLFVYLGWTMMEIPYQAWATELTRDYSERTRLALYRGAVALLGSLAWMLAPLLPQFEGTEMTPEVLRWLAVVVIAVLPLTTAAAVVFTPIGDARVSSQESGVRGILASIHRNRPFKIYALAFVLTGLGWGMQTSLIFLFFDTYLMIGDRISALMAPAMVVSLAALPFWAKIMERIGKQRAWAIGVAVGGFSILCLALIGPGPDSFTPFLGLYCLTMLAMGVTTIAPVAMLGDIVDYDILKTGINRAGSYAAAYALALKLNLALGSAAAFFLLDLFGYDPQSADNGSMAVFGMRLTYIFIPAFLLLCVAVLIWHFPITRHRQTVIRRRIESLAARETSKV